MEARNSGSGGSAGFEEYNTGLSKASMFRRTNTMQESSAACGTFVQPFCGVGGEDYGGVTTSSWMIAGASGVQREE